MVEYTIPLRNSQFRFLSDNFEALALPISRGNDEERIRETLRSRDHFDRSSRSTRLIRSLYGILGFQKIQGSNGFYFHNYFIPDVNEGAVIESLHCGVFSKEFSEGDLEILETIYRRNGELRDRGINHRYPLFYISEISERGGFTRSKAEEGLINLVGVLGFCAGGDYYYSRSWFVPRSREKLIKKLLS